MGFEENLGFYGVLQSLMNHEGLQVLRSYISHLLSQLPQTELDKVEEFLRCTFQNDHFGTLDKIKDKIKMLKSLEFHNIYQLLSKLEPIFENQRIPILKEITTLKQLKQEFLNAKDTSMTRQTFNEKWKEITDLIQKFQCHLGEVQDPSWDELFPHYLSLSSNENYIDIIDSSYYSIRLNPIVEEIEDEVDGLKLTRKSFVFTGNVIKKLQSEAKLGLGSFGNVYLCRDEGSNKRFAIKECKTSRQSSPEEIESLKGLSHKRLLEVIAVSNPNSRTLIILMEFMENGSIYDRLQIQGCFKEEATLFYTRQILEAVDYLHKNFIIHRAIKGSNILLDEDLNVKLTGFNLSEKRKNKCDIKRLFWLAPEVIRGDPFTMKSDIWSIGCTIIEMLTMYPPWADSTNLSEEHLMKLLSKGSMIIFPSCINEDMKNVLKAIFISEPLRRPSAEQLLAHESLDI